jgi:hypothetical protein
MEGWPGQSFRNGLLPPTWGSSPMNRAAASRSVAVPPGAPSERKADLSLQGFCKPAPLASAPRRDRKGEEGPR